MEEEVITELEVRRMLKQAKVEYAEMEKQYLDNPTRQGKFDLTLKVLEVRFFEAKIKNMKRRAKERGAKV